MADDLTPFAPQVLEAGCEWTAGDVADEETWTELFSEAEVAELEAAIAHARSVAGDDFLAIGKAEFPLPTLSARLKAIEKTLIDGRGFVRLRGLPRDRWS